MPQGCGAPPRLRTIKAPSEQEGASPAACRTVLRIMVAGVELLEVADLGRALVHHARHLFQRPAALVHYHHHVI